ncbi:MAG: class I SAM-dependent methyltransferase [Planctomycetes bacterium]|nr:class I SAM-dependent methyltransferase [Planctomycetota bacterium]
MEAAEFDKILEVEEANWWYRARRALVAKWLAKRRAQVGRPLEILDIACAAGMSFRHFSAFGNLRGVDISAETIRLCKGRGIDRIVQCDAMKLPFKAGSFDVVLALDALEHLPDDAAGIAEMRRVARDDAQLIVTVPAFQSLWSPHDVAFHHFRRYSRPELRRKLAAGGLAVDKLSYYSTAVFPPVFALRKLRRATASDGAATSDFFLSLPRPLEALLYAVMRAEIALMDFVNLPFGVSLFAACTIARKG